MKKLNVRKILSYVLLGTLLAFILVLTWIPVIFDIEHLDVDKWITNSMISVGIMIGGILLGEVLGEDKQKEKVNGMYQNALFEYKNIKTSLETSCLIVFFSDWYMWFKAKELLRKKEGYLVDHGFNQQLAKYIVNYIDRDDLEAMRNGIFIKKLEDGKEIKFKRLHDDEYEIVKKIYSLDFTIDAPNHTYYLSALGDSSSTSSLEEAKRIEKKEHLNKTFNRIFKITLSLFVSLIWGMATIQELTEGQTEEAVVNTFWRMVALISGLLSGFLTSVVAVKLASQKIENKTQVLTFMKIDCEQKNFITKTYEEQVEEEIKQVETAEKEEIDK